MEAPIFDRLVIICKVGLSASINTKIRVAMECYLDVIRCFTCIFRFIAQFCLTGTNLLPKSKGTMIHKDLGTYT